MPSLPPPGAKADFFFIEKNEPEEVLETLKTLIKNRIPEKFGFDPVNDVQVLTPMHRGHLGAMSLNAELQGPLNPQGASVVHGSRLFRAGDKVMQIRNNYDLEVFNGDIGRIEALDEMERTVSVRFDGRLVTYEPADLDELVLAYACSIHKSQGSEYPCVVIPIHTQHYVMLQRNLLYTGITRARKLVVLVGTRRALAIAVKKRQNRDALHATPGPARETGASRVNDSESHLALRARAHDPELCKAFVPGLELFARCRPPGWTSGETSSPKDDSTSLITGCEVCHHRLEMVQPAAKSVAVL